MIAAIIWDYDGTLVDSRFKNLNVTRVLVKYVLQKDFSEFTALTSVANYDMAGRNVSNWKELYEVEFGMTEDQVYYAGTLWTRFQLLDHTNVKLYKGIRETILHLNGVPHGIVSLNSCQNIRKTLNHNKVNDHFKEVIGYEEIPLSDQKPNPAGLVKCIDNLNLGTNDDYIVYIGDHETDARCVHNTNKFLGKKRIISIAALYEKENHIESWAIKPDYIAHETGDLLKIIEEIRGR